VTAKGRVPAVVALRLCACAALLLACSKRPLGPDEDGGGVFGPGQPPIDGGAGDAQDAGRDAPTPGCSGADPRLALAGAPLLVLDNPPVTGNLYTTLLWTGEEYLFVWRIFRGDAILMQRIDAAGRGVGGNIRLRANENSCDLAWGVDRLAAVWVHDNGAVKDLMFQTFDGLGRPLIDAVLLRSFARIPVDGSVTYGPRIAPIQDGFAIAFSDGPVFVVTVDPQGNLRRGPAAVGVDGVGRTPRLSLAAADTRLIVGWIGEGPAGPTPSGVPRSASFARLLSAGLTPLAEAIALDDDAWAGSIHVLAANGEFLALWAHGVPPAAAVHIAQIDDSGGAPVIGTMAPPVARIHGEGTPAVWSGDRLVVLGDRSDTRETGLTLSRYAPTGLRDGEPLEVPTTSVAARLHAAAHDGTVGFIWLETIDRGYQVYFQQARSCP
jgi:hypothetical protein